MKLIYVLIITVLSFVAMALALCTYALSRTLHNQDVEMRIQKETLGLVKYMSQILSGVTEVRLIDKNK